VNVWNLGIFAGEKTVYIFSYKRLPMKTKVSTQYDSSDALQLKEVEEPTSKDNKVLLKVIAAFFNHTNFQ